MYANKEDALKDENILDLQTTDKDGIATFKHLPPYYGACIKESQTIENYQIRDKEKDIILVYRDNGVRFLGEIEPKNMKVTSINQNGKEKTLDSNKNVNQELQSLVNGGTFFNKNTNWLVFNDNGKEKLVSKKPLKYGISWNSLYNAGVVFNKDGVRGADFSTPDYKNSLSWENKIHDINPNNYNPTYVTINHKRYIVRLMRAYNEGVGINNDRYCDWGEEYHFYIIKGSEWNRLILPLIEDKQDIDQIEGGRRGSDDTYKKFVENNMPTLANYSWWTDFGGNSNSSGNYDEGNDYGAYRWAQEIGYSSFTDRSIRSNSSSLCGAGSVGLGYPNNNANRYGCQPVLELVD